MIDWIAAQPFQRIDIELTGSSRKALASQIGNLFEQCGLPSEFKWDEKYIVTPLWKRDEFAPTADDKRADVNASQKAMKELLHKMDPVGAHISWFLVSSDRYSFCAPRGVGHGLREGLHSGVGHEL